MTVSLKMILRDQTSQGACLGEVCQYCLTPTTGKGSVWLPKSRVKFDPVDIGEVTTVTMPEWLAKDTGLIK